MQTMGPRSEHVCSGCEPPSPFNPRISYAFKDENGYAAEPLTYLFTSEKNRLNGGIHASYIEKKGRALAVFIGMPFQLFGD